MVPSKEEIAALLLRRDRSLSACAQLDALIASGFMTQSQANIDNAIQFAEAAVDAMEKCVELMTPP